jgi:hypothetical protein
MDERVRDVEKDVSTLKDWRMRTVDPWLAISAQFHQRAGDFITSLEAREELTDKLNAERHKANTFKLNVVVALLGFLSLVFTVLLVYVTYLGTRPHG